MPATLEDLDPHFHDIVKGCKVKPFIKRSVLYPNIQAISCNKCLTHNVETCKCGWEYGYHYGRANVRGDADTYKHSTREWGRHLEPTKQKHHRNSLFDVLKHFFGDQDE